MYAGAIMVLFVFVVMLLNLSARPRADARAAPRAGSVPAILVAVLLAELIYGLTMETQPLAGAEVGPKAVSVALYGPYVLGVELASMLLLAGLIGAATSGATIAEAAESWNAPARDTDAGLPGRTSRPGRATPDGLRLPDHALVLAAILFVVGFAGLMIAPQPHRSS